MKWHSLAAGLALALLSVSAQAQSEQTPIRIGVLSDMSGGFADVSGPGSVEAAKMAAEDYRKSHPGRPVEILSGDHQNKADVGLGLVRRWVDTEGVEAVIDVPNSAIALAVSDFMKNANKVFLGTGGVSSQLTGERCTPNTVHYSIDTWTMANVPTRTMVKDGGDTWFYISTDYAFGHDMEAQSTAALEKAGGKKLGSVAYPLGNLDFSSFLVQAQTSGAKVVALAAPNGDFVNAVKQAADFGMTQGDQKVVGLAVYISDIVSIGTNVANGAIVTNNWYWNLNDQTRDFANRFAERFKGKVPTSLQAGAYAAVWQYLAAVDELDGKSSDGKAIVAKMKASPSEDPIFGKSTIREDGRRMTPVYVWRVKEAPADNPNDVYELVQEVPVDQAYRPLNEGKCPLVTGN
ncbi:ABC transporter substrate-binding protein [Rhodoligotrophos ferricapiens]|uniref:ABC transporter substrate-binding protein n=1 Tax=Rhodoligotrophos ferricapiens TaxID=3069264 RepID=UPI00315C6185